MHDAAAVATEWRDFCPSVMRHFFHAEEGKSLQNIFKPDTDRARQNR